MCSDSCCEENNSIVIIWRLHLVICLIFSTVGDSVKWGHGPGLCSLHLCDGKTLPLFLIPWSPVQENGLQRNCICAVQIPHESQKFSWHCMLRSCLTTLTKRRWHLGILLSSIWALALLEWVLTCWPVWSACKVPIRAYRRGISS